MPHSGLKIVKSKLAKQLSGYSLILNDMEFCAHSFALAAKARTRSRAQIASGPSAKARAEQIFALDSLLRAGAVVGQFEQDPRDDSEVLRSALFEAGIVTYGRCFNSGLRTRLTDNIFSGQLANSKQLHRLLIAIRNKHVAHSELKTELSLVGCQLVE